MKVELSKNDIETLDKALVAFQREPSTSGMSGMLLEAMLGKDKSEEQRMAEMEAASTKMNEECRKRERICILLRAKLLQAENAESEHTIEVSSGESAAPLA